MDDVTYCSAIFCPLAEQCARKSFIGKPYDPLLIHNDFSKSLKFDKENDEWCCDDGIEVECK